MSRLFWRIIAMFRPTNQYAHLWSSSRNEPNNIEIYLGFKNVNRKKAEEIFVKIKKKLNSRLTGQKAQVFTKDGKRYLSNLTLLVFLYFTMHDINIPNNI